MVIVFMKVGKTSLRVDKTGQDARVEDGAPAGWGMGEVSAFEGQVYTGHPCFLYRECPQLTMIQRKGDCPSSLLPLSRPARGGVEGTATRYPEA